MVIAFRTALISEYFFVRWLFASRNSLNMQFYEVVSFKSQTLNVNCLSCWFLHQKLKAYCVSLVDSVIYEDFRYVNSTLFLALSHCSFTHLFTKLKSSWENIKHLWRSYNTIYRFLSGNMLASRKDYCFFPKKSALNLGTIFFFTKIPLFTI